MTMIIFEITTHPKGIWDENVCCSCLLVAFQVSLFNFVLTVCSVTIFFYLYFQRKERQTNPDGEPTADLLNSQSPFELWINHISNRHKYVQSWAFGNQTHTVALQNRTALFSWPGDLIEKTSGIRLSVCCLASCFSSCLAWKTSRLW